MRKMIVITALLLSAIGAINAQKRPLVQPVWYFVDQSGAPCVGCKLSSFLAGTTTPTPTYTDSTGLHVNTNPIILSVNGTAQIWVGDTPTIKLILKDSLGSTIWTADNIALTSSGGGGCSVAGTAGQFIVTNGSGGCTVTAIQVNGVSLLTPSPVSFDDSTTVTVANPSAGHIQFNATAPKSVTFQHNDVNLDGVFATNPSIFNIDDTLPTPDDGFVNCKWRTDNVTGRVSCEVPSGTTAFQMTVTPPIAGQYVIIYPTAVSTSFVPSGTVTATTKGAVLGLAPQCAGSEGAGADWTYTGALSAQAPWVVPGNITAVYSVVIGGFSSYSSSHCAPSPAPWQVGTSGVTDASTTLIGSAVTYPLQQYTQLTGLSGATVETGTAHAGVGMSGASSGTSVFTVPLIARIVYYTGTAPPADTNILVVPPLNYSTASGEPVLSLDPNFPQSLNVYTVATAPTAQYSQGLAIVMKDSNDCINTGGTGVACDVVQSGSSFIWAPLTGGGASGFPITLGSTSVGASSTTTALNGLTVNGVTLNSAGSSSLFLNQAGGYTTPAGGGGSPGGSTTQLQYNNAGAFGGDSGSTTDGAGNVTTKTVSTTGTVAGQGGTWDATEGTAPSGASSHDILYASSTTHQPLKNPNNTGAKALVGTSTTAATSGHCAQYAANGYDIADAGAACGSGSSSLTQGTGAVGNSSNAVASIPYALWAHAFATSGAGTEASPWVNTTDNNAGIQTAMTSLQAGRNGVVRLAGGRYNVLTPIIMSGYGDHIAGDSPGFDAQPNAGAEGLQGTKLRMDSSLTSGGNLVQVGVVGGNYSTRAGFNVLENVYLWGTTNAITAGTPSTWDANACVTVNGWTDSPRFHRLNINNCGVGLEMQSPTGGNDAGVADSLYETSDGIGVLWRNNAGSGSWWNKLLNSGIWDNNFQGIYSEGNGGTTPSMPQAGDGILISGNTIGRGCITAACAGMTNKNANIYWERWGATIQNNSITQAGYNILLNSWVNADGVILNASYVNVTGNWIGGQSQSGTCGIRIYGDHNTIAGNTFAGNVTDICIMSGATGNIINQPGATISDAGTGTIYSAPLASPAFTGIPTVPTAAPGTNTTQAASTAFVTAAVVGGSAFSAGVGASYQDVTEIAVPSNPGAGNDRLYTNSSTHKLACLTSAGADCMPASGGSGLTAAPPYFTNGTNFFDHDGFQVTKPLASPTWINSLAPTTVTVGANGNVLSTFNGSTSARWESQTCTTSVDLVGRLFSLESTSLGGAGSTLAAYVYDSTNSKIYAFGNSVNMDTSGKSIFQLQVNIYNYSGSGNPSYSSTPSTWAYGAYGGSEYSHVKIVKSGGTISYQVSIDGGSTYQTVGTQSVGTLSKCGYQVFSSNGSDTFNVISEVVN
jgi:hypothetical protein